MKKLPISTTILYKLVFMRLTHKLISTALIANDVAKIPRRT